MNLLIKVELERLDCESQMLPNKPSCEMMRGGFYSFFRTVNYFCLYFGFRVSSSADNSIVASSCDRDSKQQQRSAIYGSKFQKVI